MSTYSIMQTNFKLVCIACVSMLGFTGCQQKASAPQPQTASPFIITVGIKDLMAHMIDPAADAIWASVSIEQTEKGEIKHQPNTDDEWKTVRGHAIALMEGSNLLVMDGRRVAMEGHELEDKGTPGNLSAEEAQAAIDANRDTFVGFAHALHDVGYEMLKAVDAKDSQALMDAGATLDAVCEGCHLKFWYPGQKIPVFPDQAPEVDQ